MSKKAGNTRTLAREKVTLNRANKSRPFPCSKSTCQGKVRPKGVSSLLAKCDICKTEYVINIK